MKRDVRAVIFDRDGTLVEHVPYVCEAAEIRLLPWVREGIRALRERGLRLYLHTNQSGVGRGLFDLAAVDRCNQRMIDLIGMGAGVFEEVCIAPEHPDEVSAYRKPSPRFAAEVATRLDVAAESLCYVGDRGSDLQTAAAAGTQGIGVRTGQGDLEAELRAAGLAGRFPLCDSFADVVELLLGQDDE